MDIFGTLIVNNGASIVATSNQDIADIRVHSGGAFNLAAAAISHTGSGRITIDIYGSANLTGAILNVNTFSTYPGSTSYIINTNISGSKIAFYKGSNYTLAGGNVFNGGVKIDTDGDGVPDSTDNCRTTPNPGQADTDSDGAGDACDNCEQTPNPGQQDTDHDGYGNACDADLDNDGFVGPNDYNIFGMAWWSSMYSTNWNQDADFDSDGFVGPNDYNILGTRWWTGAPWK
jgi:hypothetical protein